MVCRDARAVSYCFISAALLVTGASAVGSGHPTKVVRREQRALAPMRMEVSQRGEITTMHAALTVDMNHEGRKNMNHEGSTREEPSAPPVPPDDCAACAPAQLLWPAQDDQGCDLCAFDSTRLLWQARLLNPFLAQDCASGEGRIDGVELEVSYTREHGGAWYSILRIRRINDKEWSWSPSGSSWGNAEVLVLQKSQKLKVCDTDQKGHISDVGSMNIRQVWSQLHHSFFGFHPHLQVVEVDFIIYLSILFSLTCTAVSIWTCMSVFKEDSTAVVASGDDGAQLEPQDTEAAEEELHASGEEQAIAEEQAAREQRAAGDEQRATGEEHADVKEQAAGAGDDQMLVKTQAAAEENVVAEEQASGEEEMAEGNGSEASDQQEEQDETRVKDCFDRRLKYQQECLESLIMNAVKMLALYSLLALWFTKQETALLPVLLLATFPAHACVTVANFSKERLATRILVNEFLLSKQREALPASTPLNDKVSNILKGCFAIHFLVSLGSLLYLVWQAGGTGEAQSFGCGCLLLLGEIARNIVVVIAKGYSDEEIDLMLGMLDAFDVTLHATEAPTGPTCKQPPRATVPHAKPMHFKAQRLVIELMLVVSAFVATAGMLRVSVQGLITPPILVLLATNPGHLTTNYTPSQARFTILCDQARKRLQITAKADEFTTNSMKMFKHGEDPLIATVTEESSSVLWPVVLRDNEYPTVIQADAIAARQTSTVHLTVLKEFALLTRLTLSGTVDVNGNQVPFQNCVPWDHVMHLSDQEGVTMYIPNNLTEGRFDFTVMDMVLGPAKSFSEATWSADSVSKQGSKLFAYAAPGGDCRAIRHKLGGCLFRLGGDHPWCHIVKSHSDICNSTEEVQADPLTNSVEQSLSLKLCLGKNCSMQRPRADNTVSVTGFKLGAAARMQLMLQALLDHDATGALSASSHGIILSRGPPGLASFAVAGDQDATFGAAILPNQTNVISFGADATAKSVQLTVYVQLPTAGSFYIEASSARGEAPVNGSKFNPTIGKAPLTGKGRRRLCELAGLVNSSICAATPSVQGHVGRHSITIGNAHGNLISALAKVTIPVAGATLTLRVKHVSHSVRALFDAAPFTLKMKPRCLQNCLVCHRPGKCGLCMPTGSEYSEYILRSGNCTLTEIVGGRDQGTTTMGTEGDGGTVDRSRLTCLWRPTDVAVEPDGSILTVEEYNKRVLRLSPSGEPQLIIGSTQSIDGKAVNYPQSVASEPGGSVLVADPSNHRVVRVSPSGEAQVIFRGTWPGAVASEPDGAVLISTGGTDPQVLRLSPSGTDPQVVAGGKAASLALAPDGSVLISDWSNHRVLRVSPSGGEPQVVAGGNGAGSRIDQLHNPAGVAILSDGSLLIADFMNHRVLRKRSGQEPEVVAGVGEQGDDLHHLRFPLGVAVDRADRFLVADAQNNRVLRVG